MSDKLFTLSDMADNYFVKNEDIPQNVINEIKEIVANKGFIGLAQVNPVAGNLEYNAKKIAKYIKYATEIGLDLIVFPQTALIGFSMEDVYKRHPIVVQENIKWLEGLAKITANTTVLLGFVDKNNTNSYALLENGKIDFNPNLDILKQVHVNQVGAIDNFSFEGASEAFGLNGELIARAKAFEEQFLIFNLDKNIGKIYPAVNRMQNEEFSLDYKDDMERIYKTIVQGIRDYFKKCGLKRAVLGLSGGLDSTVCAVLLVDALGKENVFGVSMPSHITSKESKSDAEQLAHNLGIGFTEATIRPMIDTTTECFENLFKTVQKDWDCRYKKSFTPDNIQARSRAMYLWGISNEFKSCIPIATSDKSEAYMGYATINGDMSGGFAPIADVTKTKLFALARWMNTNREVKNVIPESIILKRPGAELAIDPKTGKPLCAEDALMPYEFLDEIIWRVENKNQGYNDFLNIEFLYEKEHKISKEQKIEWLDKFYRRMSTAIYKWSILPPAVIVEKNTINKAVYSQPITSSGINYRGETIEHIINTLR